MGKPGIEDRVTIIGRTGSGKSQFACDFLETRNWLEMPWLILDFKGEKLIADIGKAVPRHFHKMKVTDRVPKNPGLYHIRAMPDESEAIEDFMMRIWEAGNVGFYVDEGYMLPQQLPKWKAYTYLLTQGRSLHIPMIVLYQRATWLNVFAKEQADYFAVFQLTGAKEAKTVMEYIEPARTFTGEIVTPNSGLPKYHCIWYDVSEGRSTVLRPARSRDAILKAFAAKSGGFVNRQVSQAETAKKSRAVLR